MITKAVIIEGVNRRKDRSVSIRLTTMTEQTSEELKNLDLLFQQHAVIAIKPENSPFTDAELNDLDSIDVDLEDKSKSPSKRLRNALWVYGCEKVYGRTMTKEEWRQFYDAQMEVRINQVKDKLD